MLGLGMHPYEFPMILTYLTYFHKLHTIMDYGRLVLIEFGSRLIDTTYVGAYFIDGPVGFVISDALEEYAIQRTSICYVFKDHVALLLILIFLAELSGSQSCLRKSKNGIFDGFYGHFDITSSIIFRLW